MIDNLKVGAYVAYDCPRLPEGVIRCPVLRIHSVKDRNTFTLEWPNGVVTRYIHQTAAPGHRSDAHWVVISPESNISFRQDSPKCNIKCGCFLCRGGPLIALALAGLV